MCESIVSVCSSSSSLDFCVSWFCMLISLSSSFEHDLFSSYRLLVLAKVNAMHAFVVWLPNIFHFGIIRARELLLLLLCSFFSSFVPVFKHTHDRYVYLHMLFSLMLTARTHLFTFHTTHTHILTRIYMQPSHSGIVVCVWCLSQALTWMQTLSCDFFSLPKRAMQ